MITTDQCEFYAKKKVLTVPYAVVGGYPKEVLIASKHTGEIVKFFPIKDNHPKFDPEYWDGEQMIYEPIPAQAKVEILIVYCS